METIETNQKGNPMNRKLQINAAICDVSKVTEKTLEAYDRISVNAAQLITSKQARELLSRIRFTANTADTMETIEGAVMSVQNGEYVIKAGPAPQPPVMLVVNGKLKVEKGAQEALAGYVSILVNGQALYPSSLSGPLARMRVNGRSIAYPDEAILLKDRAVIDRTFVLRARDALYYASRSLIFTWKGLDVKALAGKGARFQSKKAVIAEELLQDALPLINEDAEIVIVPEGFTYLMGDQQLTQQLLRVHGTSLFVDGDLTVPPPEGDALAQIRSLTVTGNVMLPEALLEPFLALKSTYASLFAYKGHLVADKGMAEADETLMSLYPEGVTFYDCGMVRLNKDLSLEIIRDKMKFIGCGVVMCAPGQQTAVESVCEDVGKVLDLNIADKTEEGLKQEDRDTEIINAAVYVL